MLLVSFDLVLASNSQFWLLTLSFLGDMIANRNSVVFYSCFMPVPRSGSMYRLPTVAHQSTIIGLSENQACVLEILSLTSKCYCNEHSQV